VNVCNFIFGTSERVIVILNIVVETLKGFTQTLKKIESGRKGTSKQVKCLPASAFCVFFELWSPTFFICPRAELHCRHWV
jgi:hypothetical protein